MTVMVSRPKLLLSSSCSIPLNVVGAILYRTIVLHHFLATYDQDLQYGYSRQGSEKLFRARNKGFGGAAACVAGLRRPSMAWAIQSCTSSLDILSCM